MAQDTRTGISTGLAFLPPDQVANGMLHLRNVVPDEAVPLLDYFDTTYVTGRFRRRAAQPNGVIRVGRLPPAFPPASWNVHEATVTGDPRTNNVCEGWNNKYRHLIGHDTHPFGNPSGAFRKNMKQWFSVAVIQAETGRPPTKRLRRETVQLQTRFASLYEDLNNGQIQIGQFLRGVGHLVRL